MTTNKRHWYNSIVQDCEAAGINTVGLNELLDMAGTLRNSLENKGG